MFPPNNTPAGSTPPNPAQQQQTQTPDYLTKDEFNRTAAFIRGMNEKLETLTKSVPTMDAFVSMGLFEKADDGSYKVKAAPAPKPTQQQQQAADPEWKAEIDKLNTQLKQRDDALVAERRRAAETEQRSAVVEALSKAGAVNASRDHLHLGGITKNTSGKYVQIIKDEFGADKEVALDQAADNFLKSNPELRKAQSHAGSGTPGGSAITGKAGSTDINSLAEMTTEQYFALRRSGK